MISTNDIVKSLSLAQAAALKRELKPWYEMGARWGTPEYEALRKSLGDPDRFQEALADLPPEARNVLCHLRGEGGVLTEEELLLRYPR